MSHYMMAVLLTTLLVASADAQDSLRFGAVRVGSTQVDTLRFSNKTLVDLMIDRAVLQSSVFEIMGAPFSGALSRLVPGGVRDIAVRFSPSDESSFAASVTIETDLGAYDQHLAGNGVTEVVVVNEILADPPSGIEGDANGDGVRSSSADEFVELLNIGSYPIDITGWQLSDRNSGLSKRFAFPSDTWIEPGGYVVLFGGGTHPHHFVDDGKIGGGLSNSGDSVFLFDSSGQDTLAGAVFGKEGGKDCALVRVPDGAAVWAAHTDFPGTGARFSPGETRDTFTALSIEPEKTNLAVGDTLRLRAIARSVKGFALEMTHQVLWTATPVGLIDDLGEGVWVCDVAGEVTLRASAEALVSSDLTVLIEGEGMSELRVVPADTVLLVGDTFGVSGVGVYPGGEEIGITDFGLEILNSSVVDLVDGQLAALMPGQTGIVISLYGRFATSSVRVAQSGDLDADGGVALVDAVRTVHIIAQKPPPATPFERRSADLDSNGLVDIRDVVLIVGKMLEQGPPAKPALEIAGSWRKDGDQLILHPPESTRMILIQTVGEKPVITESDRTIVLSQSEGGVNQILVLSASEGSVLDENEPQVVVFGSGGFKVQRVFGVSSDGMLATFIADEAVLEFGLTQVYPNPFNPTVIMAYALGCDQEVALSIYNPQGQELIRLFEASQAAGTYTVVWDGRDRFGAAVSSGIYLACLRAEGLLSTQKLVLVK